MYLADVDMKFADLVPNIPGVESYDEINEEDTDVPGREADFSSPLPAKYDEFPNPFDSDTEDEYGNRVCFANIVKSEPPT